MVHVDKEKLKGVGNFCVITCVNTSYNTLRVRTADSLVCCFSGEWQLFQYDS